MRGALDSGSGYSLMPSIKIILIYIFKRFNCYKENKSRKELKGIANALVLADLFYPFDKTFNSQL